MKKRNCRKTPEEIQQHKAAVEIRKMTDAQICDFLNEQSIESFLTGLKSERGIGQATIAKIEMFFCRFPIKVSDSNARQKEKLCSFYL